MGTEYMRPIMKEEMSRGKLYKYQQDAKKITEGGRGGWAYKKLSL